MVANFITPSWGMKYSRMRLKTRPRILSEAKATGRYAEKVVGTNFS